MTTPTIQDQSPSARDGVIAWSVAALVAATVLIGALVPGPAPHHAAAKPGEDTACLEWSDGCRVCQRSADGAACSLPGIACTPTKDRCLRPSGG
ncbi:hypothetical protein [Methylobacterium soli]|uniref:Uncharacterized protein n=1 Tax=Methylobacterium soli TaxID=553447 RepID=A0A6L3SVZ8_9HYPH|nr:hypothetical protein [Methylobacterium soli]KAB1077470.1 hypothetical protein F6X53_18295 [Methylobacterium soli]GJE41067.1 hypothetical protein AEGHOMDF_0227 [Methylobacterium soli]